MDTGNVKYVLLIVQITFQSSILEGFPLSLSIVLRQLLLVKGQVVFQGTQARRHSVWIVWWGYGGIPETSALICGHFVLFHYWEGGIFSFKP